LISIFDVDWQFPARIPAALPGGAGGVSSGLGATLLVDGRNSITTPTRGHYFQVDVLRHAGFIGSDFDYSHLALDARTYLPVGRGKDVIALSAYGQFNSREVPIQAMAMLSNITSQWVMRGVYLGRFRDRHQLVGQADYRGHLKGRFGYVLFGSAGNVFGSAGNDLFDDVKATYGAGLRFNVNPADPLNLRVDYTLTSFGSGGLSIGATEAF
jgi:outer membrane protein assembly factor BamA